MVTRFVMSAPQVDKLTQLPFPELAVTGRSNVGKSSLLASLFRGSKLVRTSRTPGRTQLLNLFVSDERLAWVDLPGYGYAKLSQTERARMDKMSRAYMAGRENLRGVLLLLDARREEATENDLAMAHWVLQHNRPLLLVITKADLVPKNRRLTHQRRLEKAMGVPAGWSLMVSTKTDEGREELLERVAELVG